jgi:hypothetical protein
MDRDRGYDSRHRLPDCDRERFPSPRDRQEMIRAVDFSMAVRWSSRLISSLSPPSATSASAIGSEGQD